MGRDQRLRRMGIVRKQSQAPDPLEYWRERAKYFEQVVVAIVKNSPGEVVVLEDADIRGYELDAEPTETGGVRLKLRQRDAMQESPATPKPRGPVGFETCPVNPNCVPGPHQHPPGFTGHPIREPQADDEKPALEGKDGDDE